MDAALQPAIQKIHGSGRQLVLEFTGAGSLALALLHAVPGSSRTILEATDRYCAASLHDLLGLTPGKNVDPAVAAAMAERAYLRACRLGDDSRPKLGVACTATIATDRAKRGEHRCCLAVRSNQLLTTLDLVLSKGARDRAGEEELIAAMIISAVAEASAVTPPPLKLFENEQIIRHSIAQPDALEALWAGSTKWVTIEFDGARKTQGAVAGLVYPGSFDPLHFGHEALAAAAGRVTGLPLTFELTAVNADKAPLGRGEFERRVAPFWRRHRMAVTHAPLFADKASFFPGCTFVIGFDTAARLVAPRFYGGQEAARDQALATMLAAECRVLTAGRLVGNTFKTLRDLPIPAAATELLIELPQSEFRADVSATLLRSLRQNSAGA